MSGAGCRKRAAPAPPPVVIVPSASESQPSTQPAPAEPKTKPAETKPATTPKPSPELVVPPAKKSPPHSTTPRTAPVEPPATPAETTPKPAPPRMSPRLSPAEQAEYERKTNAAIAAAEKNMQTTYGKQLNAAQSDLLEKVRGFLGQAREAARAGDWQRAHNLAQKAQVLSVELVNSL
ncbi:MAG: hypothetical protein HY012_05640 [Acidobacteria bacterium]|nr:hypothetical protein [Acidobacteriota bacterium]